VTTPSAQRVLILGGTGEARELADRLAHQPAVKVVSSLAGRVAAPRLPVGEVRVGGFGGAAGLAQWLRDHLVDAVIDATHPFAVTITGNAARAAADTNVPLIVLHRPAWGAGAGDRWTVVSSVDEAARAVPALGHRALLTVGRQEAAAFAGVDGVWFLIRCIDPPQGPLPRDHELLLARGPFTTASELELLRRNAVDLVVTKNSGGPATRAKLDAARELELPVLVVERPPLPTGVASVSSVDGAIAWLSAQSG
jgi:precorrin-6A/cobalt-precorrin-6A reductase